MQLLWETVWKLLKKLKIELSNDPVILPLGIYTEELKTRPWRDIYTPIFSTALFTIAKK